MLLWDDKKNTKLQLERNISFEEISSIILDKKYLDIIENKKYTNQKIFVIKFNKYVWAVPFLIDNENNIILKTAFPSRKLMKLYEADYEQNNSR